MDNCARQAALRNRDPVDCHMSGKGNMTPRAIENLREAATAHGWLSAEYPEAYDLISHERLLTEAIAEVAPKRDSVRKRKKKKVVKSA